MLFPFVFILLLLQIKLLWTFMYSFSVNIHFHKCPRVWLLGFMLSAYFVLQVTDKPFQGYSTILYSHHERSSFTASLPAEKLYIVILSLDILLDMQFFSTYFQKLLIQFI